MSEATEAAVQKKVAAPPAEVVLPVAYYALLITEVVALAVLHELRPDESGGVGFASLCGWAGTASMLLMHVYSIRRRVRALRHLGRLGTWLHFHIFMGLQGALLVTYHSLHLHVAASIQALNIACVLVVVLSGMIGRYLYSLIPKAQSGERLSALEVERELSSLAADAEPPTPALGSAMASLAGTAAAKGGTVGLPRLIAEDAGARAALRDLERALRDARRAGAEVARVDAFAAAARRRVLLSRRLVTLAAAERVFGGWTILHKPLTFILLGATLLHVLAHYMFGAGIGG